MTTINFPAEELKAGENPIDAMIRETREESGLLVKPETVKVCVAGLPEHL